MVLITPELKDEVLNRLFSRDQHFRNINIVTKTELEELAISYDAYNAILEQFQGLGLLEIVTAGQKLFSVILTVKAHDFIARGGFTNDEKIFKDNLNKLHLEIENLRDDLKPDKLDKAEKISSILGVIITAWAGITGVRP